MQIGMRHLGKKLFGQLFRKRFKASPQRTRLTLEQLEDRVTPTTLTVTSASDSLTDPGTLRSAINQANTDSTLGISDTIVFNPTQMGSYTITLSNGPLEIQPGTGEITIDAGGGIAIDGNNATGVLQIDPGESDSGQVVLNDLTIQDGGHEQEGGGAGITNFGTLTVSNCEISFNSSDESGGGIANAGILTVTNSTIANNYSTGGGGGISNYPDQTDPNTGMLTVSNSTISDNSAKQDGGGIENTKNAELTVSNSTLSGNSANGGDGGGIWNYYGDLTVSDSTISGNSGGGGGGIVSGIPVVLQNTIVAGNTDSSSEGDIQGSISAESAHNLIGNGFGLSGISNGDANGNQVGSDNDPINPWLVPLSYNGGPTETMAQLPGSPAIGAGGTVTTLTGAIASSNSSTITVANAAAIASTPGNYVIRIDGEEMLVTAVDLSSNTLTVTRGYNGTTATEHNLGAGVFLATDQRGQLRPNLLSDIGSYQNQSPVTSFVVSAPNNVFTDVGFPVTITAVDQNGKTVSGYNGDVTLTSTDGQHISPTLVTLTNGVATPTVVLDNVAATKLQASASALANDSNAITVNKPELVVTSQPPSTATAGEPFSITVKVEDGSGNVLTNYSDVVSISLVAPNDSSAPTLLDTVWATNGVAVFDGLSIDTAGSGYVLQATLPPVTGVTAASAPITITPGVATHMTILAAPSVVTAGNPFSITAALEDYYGNVVPYTGSASVALSANPAGTVLHGTTTISVVNGVVAFNGLALDVQTSGYAIRVTIGNEFSLTTNDIQVTAAAPSYAFLVTPDPTAHPGEAVVIIAQIRDNYGNVVLNYASPVSLTLTYPWGVVSGQYRTFRVTPDGDDYFTVTPMESNMNLSIMVSSGSLQPAHGILHVLPSPPPPPPPASPLYNFWITVGGAYTYVEDELVDINDTTQLFVNQTMQELTDDINNLVDNYEHYLDTHYVDDNGDEDWYGMITHNVVAQRVN